MLITRSTVFATVCLVVILGAATASAFAGERPFRIKIGTIAPHGSIYHRSLLEMGEKWRRSQGSTAKFTVYAGGSQGTEADHVRRMRVGQLDGAMLTVVGLTEIDHSVAALQKIPMMFRSWDELDYVREQLRPILEKRLLDKGFVVLFWGEGGWVQIFSKQPISMPEDLKPARIFVWAGDNTQVDLMKVLGYRPVVLVLSDILPGLQTGLIDAVPAAPMFALAGQFDRTARYMLRINWAPIVGATLLTSKTYNRLNPTARVALTAAAKKAASNLRVHRNTLDDNSIKAMQKRGLQVQPVTPEIKRAWQLLAQRSYSSIRGSTVPTEMFDRVVALLAEYRTRKQ